MSEDGMGGMTGAESGRPMGWVVVSPLRVRYAETDAWGICYHANYLIYFEVGRGDFLRALELDWHAVEAEGISMVVAESQTRYLAPAKYDDMLEIRTRLSAVRNRSLRFEYEVARGDQVIATGWTAHVMVRREGGAVAIPDFVRQKFLEACSPTPSTGSGPGSA